MNYNQSSSKPSPIVFCCLAVLLGYFGINVIQTVVEDHNHLDRVAIMEQQITDLKVKKQALKQQLETVKSQHFAEAEARNKLNMAKDNEVVVIFPQQSSVLGTTHNLATNLAGHTNQSLGYVDEWYKLFFD